MPKLVVGQKITKKVDLVCERKLYENKEENTKKEYNVYTALVNGIPITLQVPSKDNTGRYLLELFFES